MSYSTTSAPNKTGDITSPQTRSRVTPDGRLKIPPQVTQNLHAVYYYIYCEENLIPSIRPVDPAHPALSLFYLEHLPPPQLVEGIIRHICGRENIEYSSELRLYARTPGQGGGGTLDSVLPRQMRVSSPNYGTQKSPGLNPVVPYNYNLSATRIGDLDNPLRLFLCRADGDGTQQGMAERRMKAIPFAGIIDTTEMALKIDRNLLKAPNPVVHDDSIVDRQVTSERVHYRLFWVSEGHTAMPSRRPLLPADPSLSFTQIWLIAPPTIAQNYIKHIASLEGFHPSRLRLCYSQGASITSDMQLTRGLNATNPLLVLVDLPKGEDGEPDRERGREKIEVISPEQTPATSAWIWALGVTVVGVWLYRATS